MVVSCTYHKLRQPLKGLHRYVDLGRFYYIVFYFPPYQVLIILDCEPMKFEPIIIHQIGNKEISNKASKKYLNIWVPYKMNLQTTNLALAYFLV
jgi:hypothetical protein